MALRPRFVVVNLLTAILAIIATVFVFLTLTSKQWSIQKYYYTPSSPGNESAYETPVCVSHRSPFYRCGIPIILPDDSEPAKVNCSIPDCHFYRPYGRGRTSCSLQVETKKLAAPTNGVAQECQEVHWTGNLQIAASVFITLGLLFVLGFLVTNAAKSFSSGPSEEEPAHPTSSHRHQKGKAEASALTKPQSSQQHFVRSSSLPNIFRLGAEYSLCIGALLQLFAQFFGILALTQNATPTPAEAGANSVFGLGVSTWIMDKALTRFSDTYPAHRPFLPSSKNLLASASAAALLILVSIYHSLYKLAQAPRKDVGQTRAGKKLANMSRASGVDSSSSAALATNLGAPVGRRIVWDQFINDRGQYLWTLKPTFVASSSSGGPVYVLFDPRIPPNPITGVEPFLIELKTFNFYRQVPPTIPEPPAFRNLDNSFIMVENLNGTPRKNLDIRAILAHYKTGFTVNNNAKFFQAVFEFSAQQKLPHPLDHNVWTASNTPVQLRLNDTAKTNIPAWMSTRSVALSAPADATYVKLRADHYFTDQLLAGDSTSAQAGRLYRDGVFVPLNVITQLSQGTFPRRSTNGYIRVRNTWGDPVDIGLPDRNWASKKWLSALKTSVSAQRNFSARFRNFTGITVLFVLKRVTSNDGPFLSLDDFEIMVEEIKDEAAADIPIMQEFSVVLDGTTEYHTQVQRFNYPLGSCPFGIYDTYVENAVVAAFLSRYPDEPWPANEATVMNMVRGLKSDKLTADQAQIQGVWVTSKTVAEAGVPGARDELSTQKTLMGISATQSATASGWTDATTRLTGVTVNVPGIGDVTFDSPGTYKAEWCHRIGLAFGNVNGYEAGHTTSNIVFGSSACNSLMTRYERAFQMLLEFEDQIRVYRSQMILRYKKEVMVGLERYKLCHVDFKTLNTVLGCCRVFRRVVTPGTTTTAPSVSNVDATTTQLTTFAQWAEKYPQISLCLTYRFSMHGSYVLGGPQWYNFETMFHPFQNGFFTRLEAEVDKKSLELLRDHAKHQADEEARRIIARAAYREAAGLSPFPRTQLLGTGSSHFKKVVETTDVDALVKGLKAVSIKS